MAGFWPPADLPGLYVDLGQWVARAGTWLRPPCADYRCGRCGRTESASGPEAVARFAASVRTDHRTRCPALAGQPTT
jgi:hypothetical protein